MSVSKLEMKLSQVSELEKQITTLRSQRLRTSDRDEILDYSNSILNNLIKIQALEKDILYEMID